MNIVNIHEEDLTLVIVRRVLIPFTHHCITYCCFVRAGVDDIKHVGVAFVDFANGAYKLFIRLAPLTPPTSQRLRTPADPITQEARVLTEDEMKWITARSTRYLLSVAPVLGQHQTMAGTRPRLRC